MNIPKILMTVAFLAIVLSANIAVAVSSAEDSISTENSIDTNLENQENNDIQPQTVSTFVQPDSNKEETSTKGSTKSSTKGSTKETSTQDAESLPLKVITSSTTLSEDESRFIEESKYLNEFIDSNCSKEQAHNAYKDKLVPNHFTWGISLSYCITEFGYNTPTPDLTFSFTNSNQETSKIGLYHLLVSSTQECLEYVFGQVNAGNFPDTEESKYDEMLSCIKIEYRAMGLERINGE